MLLLPTAVLATSNRVLAMGTPGPTSAALEKPYVVPSQSVTPFQISELQRLFTSISLIPRLVFSDAFFLTYNTHILSSLLFSSLDTRCN